MFICSTCRAARRGIDPTIDEVVNPKAYEHPRHLLFLERDDSFLTTWNRNGGEGSPQQSNCGPTTTRYMHFQSGSLFSDDSQLNSLFNSFPLLPPSPPPEEVVVDLSLSTTSLQPQQPLSAATESPPPALPLTVDIELPPADKDIFGQITKKAIGVDLAERLHQRDKKKSIDVGGSSSCCSRNVECGDYTEIKPPPEVVDFTVTSLPQPLSASPPANKGLLEMAEQEKKQPVFTKVTDLRPLDNGLNLTVKVVNISKIRRKGPSNGPRSCMQLAECSVGDETGTIVFTARNEQVEVMREGATVILWNAKVNLFKGSMRLEVDTGGRIEVTESASFSVKEHVCLGR